MIVYALRRLLVAIPILVLASMIVFAAMRLLPGDPVDALYPADASVSPGAKVALRAALGLDEPLPVQYLLWLMHAVRGDLGTSVRVSRPVAELLRTRGLATLQLVALSTLLGVALALPLGILAALHQGRVADHGATALALIGLSVPGFALGTGLALVFGVWLHWVPTAGNLVLPVATQALGTAGILVRPVRAGMLDQLRREYVRTARSKGIANRAVLWQHVLPNALPVTVSVLATIVGYQLGGAIVVEQVFAWPGLGQLLFESVTGRDYAVVQGIALTAVVAFALVNLAADLTRVSLDPRLRDR